MYRVLSLVALAAVVLGSGCTNPGCSSCASTELPGSGVASLASAGEDGATVRAQDGDADTIVDGAVQQVGHHGKCRDCGPAVEPNGSDGYGGFNYCDCPRCKAGRHAGRRSNGGGGPIQNFFGRRQAGRPPYVPHVQRSSSAPGQFNPGPMGATYAYPYYTTRGPRDFLLDNPPSIGPY